MDDPPKNQTQNRQAIIDVGSNSVKLLIADVVDGVVTPLIHEGEQTRLGQGVFETGRLSPEAIEATARVVTGFATKAEEMGAADVRVLATSAAREASNGDELAAAISVGGLELEIIDGQMEAELVLRGVRSLPTWPKTRWLSSMWAAAARSWSWLMTPRCGCNTVFRSALCVGSKPFP